MAKKEKDVVSLSKNIELAVAEIHKQFGVGSLMRMTDKPEKIDFIPTSSIELNRAIGIGGFPVGKLVELYGQEMSGKTTLSTDVMVNAQRKFPEKAVAIIDVEHSYDVEYATNMGLDLSRTWIAQPGTAEEALEILERLVRSNGYSCVVLDSTGALTPESQLDSGYDELQVGTRAKLIAKSVNKLVNLADQAGTTVIFISQMTAVIKFMSQKTMEPTGGRRLAHGASLRVDMRIVEKIKQTSDNSFYGNRVKVSIDKNKLAPPHKTCEVAIFYGIGISRELELLELGSRYGVIESNKHYYTLQGTQYSGKIKAMAFLRENKDYCIEIEKGILTAIEMEKQDDSV